MLRRLSRRFAPRAKHHEELVRMWRERPQPAGQAKEGSGLQFRDTRPTPVNEPDDAKRRRLLYQSSYRGMVEMDIILGVFARQNLDTMTHAQLEEYDALLRQFDNDLFKWLVMGEAPPAAVAEMPTFAALQDFVQDEKLRLLGQAV
ncbi:hypothetical protein DQ04_01731100 [Trypanosoma grayi]|uniref:hypothetical protein n=1 Tax=Trypanosoma grayi TaxID=71804 RepID=UPI0004F49565|nr:hypothetical protein DQ04_01731100 [Trypanosoma grayi]KEG12422.1 hypothetical protein DQ04_01731100 [Trypanosoma grayi]